MKVSDLTRPLHEEDDLEALIAKIKADSQRRDYPDMVHIRQPLPKKGGSQFYKRHHGPGAAKTYCGAPMTAYDLGAGDKAVGTVAPVCPECVELRTKRRGIRESVSQADIDNIVQYASQRVFPSEKEARQFVSDKDQAGSPWNFGVSTGYWNEMSKVIPVYQTPKGWKLGDPKQIRRLQQKRYRRQNPAFSWKNITLLEPNFTELRSFGFMDMSDRIVGPKMVSMASLTPTESGQDEDQISEIIQWIKEDGEFKPLVIEESGAIVDGHHRYMALLKMKVKRVPVYTVVRGS